MPSLLMRSQLARSRRELNLPVRSRDGLIRVILGRSTTLFRRSELTREHDPTGTTMMKMAGTSGDSATAFRRTLCVGSDFMICRRTIGTFRGTGIIISSMMWAFSMSSSRMENI